MDLVVLTKEAIGKIPDNVDISGLNAVVSHIETAIAHRDRGVQSKDSSAFADSIYRTNQAYEGGLKEAYKVLADKNPKNKSPFEIEKYLTENRIFRPRILQQVATYRKDWRNPSTHDYKLDFDSDESLLAITSVCALTILLADQLVEKSTHDKILVSSGDKKEPIVNSLEYRSSDFLHRIALVVKIFASTLVEDDQSESETIGALTGLINSIVDGAKITGRFGYRNDGVSVPDLVVENEKETIRIMIEIRREKALGARLDLIVKQMDRYLADFKLQGGILITNTSKGKVQMREFDSPSLNKIIMFQSE